MRRKEKEREKEKTTKNLFCFFFQTEVLARNKERTDSKKIRKERNKSSSEGIPFF